MLDYQRVDLKLFGSYWILNLPGAGEWEDEEATEKSVAS
jgi:hypothetical protein